MLRLKKMFVSFLIYCSLLPLSLGQSEEFPSYACEDDTPGMPGYGPDGLPTFRPLIIAHRGASGMYPEHTALAYRKAAEQGADLIECDLALTRDGHFILAHDPWLSLTTDIAQKAEFADRKTTYTIDDDDEHFNWNDKGNITDWFSFDFDLAELRTLKKRQASDFRDPRYDWQETVVTLEELVEITKEMSEKQGRTIGIYPELKYPHAMNKILTARNISKKYEDFALDELIRLRCCMSKDSPCYIQSFEISSLEYVRQKVDTKFVFLTYNNLTDTVWEKLVNLNISGIGAGVNNLVTPGVKDDEGRGSYEVGGPTEFIDIAHRYGMKVHGWTFANEWMKLYWDHGQDPYSQLEEFLALGIDGFISDFPLTARRFLHYKGKLCSKDSSSASLSSIALLNFSVLLSIFS